MAKINKKNIKISYLSGISGKFRVLNSCLPGGAR
jgi:hypothetical protein